MWRRSSAVYSPSPFTSPVRSSPQYSPSESSGMVCAGQEARVFAMASCSALSTVSRYLALTAICLATYSQS